MQRTYKFRLYPNKDQEEYLLNVLDLCKWIYDFFLSKWSETKKIPSQYKFQAMVSLMKEKKPELRKVNSKTLQMVLFEARPYTLGSILQK